MSSYIKYLSLYNCLSASVHELISNLAVSESVKHRSRARFTKYLTTVLRLSYDNAKATIDLRRTSNLQHPTKGARLFLRTIHLQSCNIV